ncbi:MAG: disulfide bond formation protein B [Methyloceanibacter sp.]|nr:disulfide bond formation protein B [Methyloceanibacter sp.]
MSPELSKLLNALGLIAIGAVLTMAFIDQVWFGELPCPLCILQRAGLIAAGCGLMLNVVFGPKPSHYGIAIIGAVASAAISMRQVLQHIVPGTGFYGPPVWGMHLYTWAFLFAVAIVIGSGLMLLGDRQFSQMQSASGRLKGLPLIALLLFLVLTLANIFSTVALCGTGLCPEEPVDYELFHMND